MKPNVQANRIYSISYNLNDVTNEYRAIYWDKDKAKEKVNDLTSCADKRTTYFKVFEYKIHEDGAFYLNRKVYHLYFDSNENEWVTIVDK